MEFIYLFIGFIFGFMFQRYFFDHKLKKIKSELDSIRSYLESNVSSTYDSSGFKTRVKKRVMFYFYVESLFYSQF